MIVYFDQAESPAGPVSFGVNAVGELIRLSFIDGHHELSLGEELARDGYQIRPASDLTLAIREQIEAYTRGELLEFDIPVSPAGTDWQKRVWRALTEIPFGETRSYGEIAREVCTVRASRAVGRANATNPIPLVIPCHRVIGSNGSLTGFGGGLHLKRALLEHEVQVLRSRDDAPAGTQRTLLPAD